MNIELIEEPIRFHLHSIGAVVENERYGEVGFRLMNNPPTFKRSWRKCGQRS